jgi:hypothetical protein
VWLIILHADRYLQEQKVDQQKQNTRYKLPREFSRMGGKPLALAILGHDLVQVRSRKHRATLLDAAISRLVLTLSPPSTAKQFFAKVNRQVRSSPLDPQLMSLPSHRANGGLYLHHRRLMALARTLSSARPSRDQFHIRI